MFFFFLHDIWYSITNCTMLGPFMIDFYDIELSRSSKYQRNHVPLATTNISQPWINHLPAMYEPFNEPFIFHSSRIYQPFFNHLSILSCLDHVTSQCFPSLSRIGCLSELWTCQRWTFRFFFVRGGSIQADETFQVGDIWYCHWYMLFFLLSLLLLLLCVYYT